MLLARSRDRHTRHQFWAATLTGGNHASVAPQLWELEALISAGCDLTEALIVISDRREVSGGERMRPAMAAAYQVRVS